MRWEGRRQSENIEDRRSLTPRMAAGGGLGLLLLVLVVGLLGGDPRILLNSGTPPPSRQGPVREDPAEARLKEKVGVILADTEDVWTAVLAQRGVRYPEPTLVLFRDRVESACGFASAAVGPFYCGEDRKVYLDLAFLQELDERFGAPGDFAQAYVVAHEIGHHVQNVLGTLDRVHAMQGRMSETQYNRLSVRLELQADYYAGVWAHHDQKMKKVFDRRDIEDGLRAASAIGDDRLQEQGRGYVVPESFTHGTSDQRARWFMRGLQSGDLRQGDTFAARDL